MKKKQLTWDHRKITNMNCTIHNTQFKQYKDKNGNPYMGHWDNATKGMCFAPKELQPSPVGPETPAKTVIKTLYDNLPEGPVYRTREPVVEPKVDWEAKDRQSLAQTAMKSASEIVAAMINAGLVTTLDPSIDVKTMANDLYKELKSMKSES